MQRSDKQCPKFHIQVETMKAVFVKKGLPFNKNITEQKDAGLLRFFGVINTMDNSCE